MTVEWSIDDPKVHGLSRQSAAQQTEAANADRKPLQV